MVKGKKNLVVKNQDKKYIYCTFAWKNKTNNFYLKTKEISNTEQNALKPLFYKKIEITTKTEDKTAYNLFDTFC